MKSESIVFSHRGIEEKSELNWEKPVVYKGQTRLYDNTQDPARIVTSSSVIPPQIAQKLTGIKGKCLLTRGAHGTLGNVHVFSSKALVVDGVERICYLEYQHGTLLVREYNGSKTANYSAHYRILEKLLKERGFDRLSDGNFAVPDGRVGDLVALINCVNQWREEQKMVLEPSQEIDSISFKKTRQYFFKVYWRLLDPSVSVKEIEKPCQTEAVDISSYIKETAKRAMNCVSNKELEEIEETVCQLKKQLLIAEEMCQTRREQLKKIELLEA